MMNCLEIATTPELKKVFMLNSEETERKSIEDNKVKEGLLKVLDELKGWITDICTQEWPYEGCPRGPVWLLGGFEELLAEVREFADKIYERYLGEIDSRRSA